MTTVTKYDRKGYKPRPRQLAVTSSAIYIITNEHKIKEIIQYTDLVGKQ